MIEFERLLGVQIRQPHFQLARDQDPPVAEELEDPLGCDELKTHGERAHVTGVCGEVADYAGSLAGGSASAVVETTRPARRRQ